MAFRVTVFFEQSGDKSGGWSMNFWNNTNDLSLMQPIAQRLVDRLDDMTGVETRPVSVRISEIGAFRRIFQFTPVVSPRGISTAPTTSDYVNTALLMKLGAAPSYQTRQWLRGIHDSVVVEGGKYRATAALMRRYTAFFTYLASGGDNWSLRVQSATAPNKDIEAISGAGVVTITGHGFPATPVGGTGLTKVRITRCKGDFFYNGVWSIKNVTTDTFSLVGWVAPGDLQPYRGGGKAILQLPVLVAINGGTFLRATSHKTGRPSNVLTGRRKKARR